MSLFENTNTKLEKLSDREWNRIVDTYLATETMHQEEYDRMTDFQGFTIQTLKKAFKRIKYKLEHGQDIEDTE